MFKHKLIKPRLNKWPPSGNVAPHVESMFRQDGSITNGWHNTIAMTKSFKRYFEDMNVFDIHESDVIEQILCKLLDAPTACASYQERGESEVKKNCCGPRL